MEKNERINQGLQRPNRRLSRITFCLICLIAVACMISGCDLVDGLSNLADNIGEMLQGALK